MARNRVKKRRVSNRQWFALALDHRTLLKMAAAAVVMVLAWVGTAWLMDRPIDTVKVAGTFERVSAVQVEAALAPHLGGGFLSTDLNRLRRELTKLPWIARASIRRKWPAYLEVTVQEEQPAACWGEDGLLNTDGILFVEHASHVPVELPRLNGPPGTQTTVARRYFDLQARLEQRGLSAVSLTVDKRGAWELQLNNGVLVRFGATAIDDRVARFFQALDQVIASRGEQVEYLDMRYTNGFAIRWKDRSAKPAAMAQEIRPDAW